MDKKTMVNNLIANGKWTEEDTDFLMGLEEDKLAKMDVPVVNTEEDPEKKETSVVNTEEDPEKKEISEKKETSVVNTAEFLANAPAEVREVLNEAMQTQASKKLELISNITINKKNVFTKDQLSSMSVLELNAIAALAKEEAPDPTRLDFSGQGPVGNAEGEVETPLEAPTMNFIPKEK